eukprot:CAMPEP_0116888430 /NCGR_PEP_ID=MMETSP0463-20121206/23433_1 /TAXON_ID=181622 /ORGANISM="Strombidinopsis sp, Strain SopsisLIS2011" /LENGTH=52 /DNA_ID=CAMNT_0004553149 /DNA_START=24 /DNA_END=179 /DNA_ORIENTATION=-
MTRTRKKVKKTHKGIMVVLDLKEMVKAKEVQRAMVEKVVKEIKEVKEAKKEA